MSKLLPDHRLSLKPGYMVIILQNSLPKNRYVNETQYKVESISNKALTLRIATGTKNENPFCFLKVHVNPGATAFAFLSLKGFNS